MLGFLTKKFNNYQIIALFFVVIILLGAFLLSLPISSKSREFTPFIDALFTATSATCVTGLIVYDTFLHWSLFGQLIILLMIQIGGIGFMTVMTVFSMFLRKQLSLHEKTLFMQTAGNSDLGGTTNLIKKVAVGTLLFETFGALLLCIPFIRDMGAKGIYPAIFHSIAAFCNAGFDILGSFGAFSSLTSYRFDVIVNLTIIFLITAGGIGFLVWSDLINNRFKWKNLSLHSKMVLSASTFLIFGGALLFFLFEKDHSLLGMNSGEQFLASLFQSVTPRTAGFNTISLTELSGSGRTLICLLMFIGGSPGSTAGGVKTTTIIVLMLTVVALIKKKDSLRAGKRRLEESTVMQSAAIVMLYSTAILLASMTICAIQDFPMYSVIFEVISAIGTVGLTLGITPELNVISKLIIIFLMFGGRVGMLSLAMIFASKKKNVPLDRPVERIIIG